MRRNSGSERSLWTGTQSEEDNANSIVTTGWMPQMIIKLVKRSGHLCVMYNGRSDWTGVWNVAEKPSERETPLLLVPQRG